MVEYSVQYLSKLLTVNSFPELDLSDITVDSCGKEITIDASIKKKYSADYVLFVTDDPSKGDTSFNPKSYGGHCYKDTNHNGRPIMGRVVLKPNYFPLGNKDLMASKATRIIHDIIHCLGFSSDMIEYFLDETGKPRGKEIL